MIFRFIFFFLLLLSYRSAAQPGTAQLGGQVFDPEGNPLADVRVEIHELHIGALTDSLGKFNFSGLRPGLFHLHLEYIGYLSQTHTADIRSGEGLFLIFNLKPSDIELTEIVIEADPFKTDARQATQTVETADQTFLLKNTGADLISALSRLPGINRINTGIGIAKPVIRGMSLNRVAVVENGIKQEGQQWGTDHGLELDQFNVNRVEIIKGPAALAYGSDAIGGVMRIRSALPPPEKTLKAGAVFGYQSVNQNYQGSVFAETMQKGWLIRGRFSYQDYGDYRVPARRFTYNRWILPILNNELKNTAGRERNGAFSIGKYGKRGNTVLNMTYFHQTSGIFSGAFGTPRVTQLLNDGNNRNIGLPQMITSHLKIISNSNILLGKNWLETDLGFQYNHRQEKATPHTHGFTYVLPGTLPPEESLVLKLMTLSANARYHFKIKKWDGIAGFSSNYQQNRRGGYEFFLPNFEVFNAGLFLYGKYAFGSRFYINGGIRSDFQQTDISAHDQSVYSRNGTLIRTERLVYPANRTFAHTSFAGGISWFPTEKWNLKFNVANGFRFPNGAELGSRGIHHGTFRYETGDSSLNPEYGYQFDWNLTYQSKVFQFKLSPFLNLFENYIYLSPMPFFAPRPDAGQVYQYLQTPALFYGGEISVDLHVLKGVHWGVGADYVYNYNRLTELPLPFTPPPSVKSELEIEFPAFFYKKIKDAFISGEIRYTAAQNRTDRNELTTPEFTVINLKAGFKVQLFKKQEPVSFFFQVNNLTDRIYFAHLSRYRLLNIPEPGRNFVITLSVPAETVLRKSPVKAKKRPREIKN